MDSPPSDFSGERLVRKAPNHPLELSAGDQDYIRDALAAVEAAFERKVTPDVPFHLMPGRSLMRLLVDLRRSLRPANPLQSEAWGRLAGAVLILDTACSFTTEHEKAMANRLQGKPPPDPK